MPGAHVFPGGGVEAGETHQAAGLRELFEEAGIRLALVDLVPFARWRTPSFEARRFEAQFFVARMPRNQTPVLDTRETTGGDWLQASVALGRCRRREILLPLPTWTSLREIEPFATVDDVLTWAPTRPNAVREPRLVVQDDRKLLVLPGDPLNEDAWPEAPPIDSRFELEGDRWTPVPSRDYSRTP